MNWEMIGALAEALGAAGVIASLLYVGRQFRHSSTSSIQAMSFDFAHMVGDSVENASVLRRGIQDPESLNPDEAFQFSVILYNLYSYANFVHVQHSRGLVNPDLAQRTMALLDFYHLTPGVRAWFEGRVLNFTHGRAFSQEFLEYLDETYGTSDRLTGRAGS